MTPVATGFGSRRTSAKKIVINGKLATKHKQTVMTGIFILESYGKIVGRTTENNAPRRCWFRDRNAPPGTASHNAASQSTRIDMSWGAKGATRQLKLYPEPEVKAKAEVSADTRVMTRPSTHRARFSRPEKLFTHFAPPLFARSPRAVLLTPTRSTTRRPRRHRAISKSSRPSARFNGTPSATPR